MCILTHHLVVKIASLRMIIKLPKPCQKKSGFPFCENDEEKDLLKSRNLEKVDWKKRIQQEPGKDSNEKNEFDKNFLA